MNTTATYEPAAEDIQAYNLDQELASSLDRGKATPIASIRWSFGTPVITYLGDTSGSRFTQYATMTLKAGDALISRGACEKTLAPYDNSQETVELISWYRQDGYSDHSGWALVNRGAMNAEKFAWVVARLLPIWPANKGNYSAAGLVFQNERVTVFESHCHGIGD